MQDPSSGRPSAAGSPMASGGTSGGGGSSSSSSKKAKDSTLGKLLEKTKKSKDRVRDGPPPTAMDDDSTDDNGHIASSSSSEQPADLKRNKSRRLSIDLNFAKLLNIFAHQDELPSKPKNVPSDWQLTPTSGGDGTQLLLFTQSKAKAFGAVTYPVRFSLVEQPDCAVVLQARKLSPTILSLTFQDHLLPREFPKKPFLLFDVELLLEGGPAPSSASGESGLARTFSWINTPLLSQEQAGLVNLLPSCFADTSSYFHHLASLQAYNLSALRSHPAQLAEFFVKYPEKISFVVEKLALLACVETLDFIAKSFHVNLSSPSARTGKTILHTALHLQSEPLFSLSLTSGVSLHQPDSFQITPSMLLKELGPSSNLPQTLQAWSEVVQEDVWKLEGLALSASHPLYFDPVHLPLAPSHPDLEEPVKPDFSFFELLHIEPDFTTPLSLDAEAIPTSSTPPGFSNSEALNDNLSFSTPDLQAMPNSPDRMKRSASLPMNTGSQEDPEDPATQVLKKDGPLEIVLSHNIPHRNHTTNLFFPVVCAHCREFIWGIYKEAIGCHDCDKLWHLKCEQFIANDCGFDRSLLVGVLTKEDPQTPPTSPTYKKKTSLSAKTIKAFTQLMAPATQKTVKRGHIFNEYNYKLPGWCKHCNGYIFGMKQGYRCEVCNLDCHQKCLSQLTQPCITAGQLAVNQMPRQKDTLLVEKVKSRRTSSQIRQPHFNRQAQTKINNEVRLKSETKTQQLLQEIDSIEVEKQRAKERRRAQEAEKAKEKASEKGSEASFVQEQPLQPLEPLEPANPRPKDPSKAKINLTNVLKKRKAVEHSVPILIRKNLTVITEDASQSSSEESKLLPPALQLQRLLQDTPQTMADYEILEDSFLGRGQFSIVRSGVHISTGADVAVKIIDKARFIQKPQSQRFLKREVEILMSVAHPNIIKLYTIEDTPTSLFMFMELVEGGDLLAYVESKGRLKEDEGKFIFHQLLVAVRYLHDRGIVHRDLKPENVLLADEDGVKRLKIADFGFARIIEKNTLVNSVVGTPSYMAPEVLKRNGKGYKESADMWSIGVMLYACLGGVFPFEEDEPVEDQIKNGRFCFPDEFFGDVSDEGIDLCCSLLVVQPDMRYSADEAVKHIWFSTSSPLNI